MKYLFFDKKVVFFILLFLFQSMGVGFADDPNPIELKDVGIVPNMGAQLPLDLKFKRHDGVEVQLKDLIKDKPVIVTLVYFSCPHLCTFVLNGLVDGLAKMDWSIGNKFSMISLSIDPAETPELAQAKRESYLKQYGRSDGGEWTFLTGSEENIKKVADTLGFYYRYDEKQKDYAHGAGLFVISPDGKLSRVIGGMEYKPRDIKLALLDASQGKVGSAMEHFFLRCFIYDPIGKKYAIAATRIMKVAGALTVVVLAALLFYLNKKKRIAQ